MIRCTTCKLLVLAVLSAFLISGLIFLAGCGATAGTTGTGSTVADYAGSTSSVAMAGAMTVPSDANSAAASSPVSPAQPAVPAGSPAPQTIPLESKYISMAGAYQVVNGSSVPGPFTAGQTIELNVAITREFVTGNTVSEVTLPDSVYVEYWQSPNGARQRIDLPLAQANTQGLEVWSTKIAAPATGSYEIEAFAVSGNSTVTQAGAPFVVK